MDGLLWELQFQWRKRISPNDSWHPKAGQSHTEQTAAVSFYHFPSFFLHGKKYSSIFESNINISQKNTV